MSGGIKIKSMSGIKSMSLNMIEPNRKCIFFSFWIHLISSSRNNKMNQSIKCEWFIFQYKK